MPSSDHAASLGSVLQLLLLVGGLVPLAGIVLALFAAARLRLGNREESVRTRR